MFTSKGRCTEQGCGRVGDWSETYSCYLCDSCHGARVEVAKFAKTQAALPIPAPPPECIGCGATEGTLHSKTFDAPVCLYCLDNMILGRVLKNDPRVFLGLQRLADAVNEVTAEAIRTEGVDLHGEVSDAGVGAIDSDRDIFGASDCDY